nr:hypothetical protein [Tanacetum cinerariifolium]
MVDFIKASPLRYALTVKPTIYVSHIRQFWSIARIETTKEGTKILATVDDILRTVTESSLRRNLKLKDEDGISSLPDTELFENLTLMGYNISPNQKIVPIFDTMLVQQGKGSGTPTEPHHTPSPEAQPPSHTTHSSSSLPSVTTTIPTITPTETTLIRQYTRRARISQSSALPTIADEPTSPLRDVSQGEACPTDSGFIANQDRATIAKSSTLPYDSAPRVTSPAADEGTQEMEINRLKERVKLLEDKEGVAAEGSRADAPTKRRNLDEGEAAAERASNDTEEMATVLTSMDAATVLASGTVEVPTGSGSIPTAGPPAVEVPTGSGSIPTAGPPAAEVPTGSDVVSTATVVTPYRRRKGKKVMVESDTPKKQKVQEQIDAQVAREMEEQLEREDQRRSEQIARDAEIARIHAKEELQIMIDDFIHMGSKEEAKRIKRKGLSLEQESAKKLKTLEEAQPPSHTTHSSSSLPPVTTTIPTVTPTETTPIMQYTRRARISQSSTLPTVADEPTSPLRDVSQWEACPTDSGFIANQDRATIAKSSTLPYDSAPRVTSPAADEGSGDQQVEERVKLLEDREGVAAEGSRADAPTKWRNLDEREAAAERASNDTEEMATVLTSMDAATVLASGTVEVPTGSGSIPTAGPSAAEVPTGSGSIPTSGPPAAEVPTGSDVVSTATVVTPYRRRKGKKVMVESDTPKKQKVQEQIDAQVTREMEEQLEREDQRRSEQIDRDAEIVRIHAEEELQIMIDVPEEKVKEMMQLVPIKEVYVEALQVKHPIIDWKVHTEGQRSYWKITRLGGSSASYQFFIDLLKHLDREDLNQL